MEFSSKAKNIFIQIENETTKLGDLRKIAKEINYFPQAGVSLQMSIY